MEHPGGENPIYTRECQLAAARELLFGSFDGELQWPWAPLSEKVGPIIKGDFVLIGARPGSGKTTLLMNATMAWVHSAQRVIYVGMESSPDRLRLQLAAWDCGLDYALVVRKQWHALPADARRRLGEALTAQSAPPLGENLLFVPDERVTLHVLDQWIRVAGEDEWGVVVVDHLHRMDWGGGDNLTGVMTEGIRHMKSSAKQHNVRLLVAAQLNRGTRDPLEDYMPPPLSAIKQSGAAEEEADLVLMPRRALIESATEGDLKQVRQGQKSVAEVSEPGCMAARIAKCRLDGDVRDMDVRLYLHKGRVYSTPAERDTHAFEDRYAI